ncbi:MAG: hypothetical protein ABSE73_15935 [Planctomycetota bacterium]
MVMRYAFGLLMLVAAAVVLQLAVLPAFVPELVRPDAGILLGMAALAFGPREFGLACVFALGVQADLFGSARFGLLTLCNLLAARLILWVAWRELTRGDLLAAWAGGIAGTFLTHLLYLLLGPLCGLQVRWGQAGLTLLALVLGACVWGLVCAWACGRFMYRLNLVSLPVREHMASDDRLSAARRAKVARS